MSSPPVRPACAGCGASAEAASPSKLQACGQCHRVLYCGTACQRRCWRVHKAATCWLWAADVTESVRTHAAATERVGPRQTVAVEEGSPLWRALTQQTVATFHEGEYVTTADLRHPESERFLVTGGVLTSLVVFAFVAASAPRGSAQGRLADHAWPAFAAQIDTESFLASGYNRSRKPLWQLVDALDACFEEVPRGQVVTVRLVGGLKLAAHDHAVQIRSTLKAAHGGGRYDVDAGLSNRFPGCGISDFPEQLARLNQEEMMYLVVCDLATGDIVVHTKSFESMPMRTEIDRRIGIHLKDRFAQQALKMFSNPTWGALKRGSPYRLEFLQR